MPGRPTFRQADLKKALRAAVTAGVALQRVEIDLDGGKITMIPARPNADDNETEFDRWKASHADQA